MRKFIVLIPLSLLVLLSCDPKGYERIISKTETEEVIDLELEEIASIFSSLPIGTEQMKEVFDAVSLSAGNGYDDEYTMSNLFESPGTGVGSAQTKAAYSVPLKDMFLDYLSSAPKTKAGEIDPEAYIRALKQSDIQIYWPNYADWKEDGKEIFPIITFDPEDGSSSNIGYAMADDGTIKEITVDEELANSKAVWVINRNDDRDYESLEVYKKKHPECFEGGVLRPVKTKAPDVENCRSLILRDVTMLRQFDSWFAGASEFFVKCGAVEDFVASTEAELKLYNPSITDFMMVIRRREKNKVHPFNVVLVSEWTEQLEKCAFMMIEDDGGERTSWKTEAIVKVNSKSYGVDVNLPFRTRDDIVWRGQLSYSYLEKNAGERLRFGDVELTFDIVE